VEAFRATKVTFSAASNEGHQTMTFEGHWAIEPRDVAAGALFVPSAQAKARLVAALLEPQAPDSLGYWGLFTTAFEKKEYMEDYVAEDVARQMMAADPALAAEFKRRLESDSEFAKSKSERLAFFHRRSPSWTSATTSIRCCAWTWSRASRRAALYVPKYAARERYSPTPWNTSARITRPLAPNVRFSETRFLWPPRSAT
jgi:hypothetical protein